MRSAIDSRGRTRLAGITLLLFGSAMLFGGAWPSEARQFACVTVRPDDTAAHLARRLTGSPGAHREPWFAIVDPGRVRTIPKTEYDDIRPGWQACVGGLVQARSAQAQAGWPAAPGEPAAAPIDRTAVLMWAALAVAGVLMWSGVSEHLERRELTLARMRQFGERFVREFERPLVEAGSPAHPLRSELRARPDGGRLDVRLAPAGARRYPNLADHRANVLYDVDRVLETLGDHGFSLEPLYSTGSWVVVPFRLRHPDTEAGQG